MTTEPQVWCYIARTVAATKHHGLGVVVCATVDEPTRAKATAKDVAEWIRDGLAIERVPVEWLRQYLLTTEVYRP